MKLFEIKQQKQTAAGCIFLAKNSGKLLIARRGDDVDEPGTWGTWGGSLNNGESPKAAAEREAREETGFEGKMWLKPIWTFKHHSGFEYHTFIATVEDEFRPILNWENKDAKWVSYGKWPAPLHSGFSELLKHAADKLS